jgi:hypothetical protein
MLGINPEVIRYTEDSTLGKEVRLPENVNLAMTKLIASYEHPEGTFLGDAAQLHDYKGNVVSLLSALHQLKKFSGVTKKAPRVRRKGGSFSPPNTVSQESLLNTINNLLGLKKDDRSVWARNILVQTLSELVKPTNPFFPGKFISQAKKQNNLTSSEALVLRLGYTWICVDPSKLLSVLNYRTVEKSNGRLSIVKFEEDKSTEEYTFQEYRAGICGLLPFVVRTQSPKNSVCEPYKVTNLNTLEHFKSVQVDAYINLAYAVLRANLANVKTASPLQFKNCRDAVINCFNNPVFRDGDGNVYAAHKEIPTTYRDFFAKLLHRKTVDRKRSPTLTEEDPDTAMDDARVDTQADPTAEKAKAKSSASNKKQKKKSKGKQKATTSAEQK